MSNQEDDKRYALYVCKLELNNNPDITSDELISVLSNRLGIDNKDASIYYEKCKELI